MNIYLFELKAQRKSFVIWTAVLVLALIVFMSGVYPVFYDSLDTITAMLESFPPEFAAAFGVHLDDMFSFGGFFGFTFTYLGLMGAIMAVSLSVSSLAREKRAKCVDFLLTKPRSRQTIFTAKLLSSLTVLAATNVIYIAATIVLYTAAGQATNALGEYLLASAGLFLTQLVFYAIGILYAVFAKKIRSVSGIATAVGFAGFILSALYGILEEEIIRFIAPLKYFDPAAVITTGNFDAKYAVTGLIVIAACVLISYVMFDKRDAHAV